MAVTEVDTQSQAMEARINALEDEMNRDLEARTALEVEVEDLKEKTRDLEKELQKVHDLQQKVKILELELEKTMDRVEKFEASRIEGSGTSDTDGGKLGGRKNWHLGHGIKTITSWSDKPEWESFGDWRYSFTSGIDGMVTGFEKVLDWVAAAGRPENITEAEYPSDLVEVIDMESASRGLHWILSQKLLDGPKAVLRGVEEGPSRGLVAWWHLLDTYGKTSEMEKTTRYRQLLKPPAIGDLSKAREVIRQWEVDIAQLAVDSLGLYKMDDKLKRQILVDDLVGPEHTVLHQEVRDSTYVDVKKRVLDYARESPAPARRPAQRGPNANGPDLNAVGSEPQQWAPGQCAGPDAWSEALNVNYVGKGMGKPQTSKGSGKHGWKGGLGYPGWSAPVGKGGGDTNTGWMERHRLDRGMEREVVREEVWILGRPGKGAVRLATQRERAKETGRAASAASMVISPVNATLTGQGLA